MEILKRWDQPCEFKPSWPRSKTLWQLPQSKSSPLLRDRLEQARTFLGKVDLLALLKQWKTPPERQPLAPRPEPPPAADRSSTQEQTEVLLRNEVDIWRRRYIYGQR